MQNFENKQEQQMVRSKKKSKKKHRKLIIVVLCILAVLAAVAVFATYYIDNTIGKLDIVETPKGNAEWGIDADVATSLKGYQNIAILGVDSYKSTGDNFSGTRTDAILIASINKKTNQVKFLSVMRDSYLQVQESDGDYVFTKINHAHAYGGPLDTCKSLNRNLDLNITQFVVFNWKSVAEMVDAVGGVDLDVSADELSDMNISGASTASALGTTYTPITQTGLQHLDGVQAATYCRIRKNSGGDGARTERSRETLTAIFSQAKNLNLDKLQKITNDALPEIRTNITKTQMVKYMVKIKKYSLGESIVFPTKYRGGLVGDLWYAVPRTLETNAAKVHEFLFAQDEYVLSGTAQEISDKIVQRTGFGL
jgi:polyisoprenyl-teichoic acid--peptidoglycan teichoic acid transferase